LNIRNIDFAGSIPSPSSLLSELKPPARTEIIGYAETSAVDVECEHVSAIDKPATEMPGDTKDPCVVCLGALQTSDVNDGALQQIEEIVRKDGYVFDKFCLEVSVPAIAVVRERSLWYVSNVYSIRL